MSSLKKLASDTIWYGLSNIAAKMLNQLQTPLLTWILQQPAAMLDYGNFTKLMAYISFMNVIYTYGLETAYFRFSSKGDNHNTIFQTTFSSLLISTLILTVGIIGFSGPISQWVHIAEHPEYISWCALIIATDTMAAIPFAKLRQESRPKKYAFVRVAGIVVNLIATIFFIAIYPKYMGKGSTGWFASWYYANTNVGYLLMANLMASATTFLLLYKEWLLYRFVLDKDMWKKLVNYSAPMVIVGLAGMVNETFDRIMLSELLPGTEEHATIVGGIYGANYKIAIFITLFITAFRMSAEPFFFNQAKEKNAPTTYARVMKWFVIILCFAFLFTALFLDLWKFFVGPAYREGLGVVPILLAANVCLGIYYNLSVWYKITDRMRMGMYITLIGAAITLLINYTLIPVYGMYACAWATFTAYGSMMLISYALGQKYFPVPYNVKKLSAYLLLMAGLFFIQKFISSYTDVVAIRLATGTVLMLAFIGSVLKAESEELSSLPVVGKYLKK